MTEELWRRIAALPPERRALLEQELLRRQATGFDDERIPRRQPGAPAPLSFAQTRLWFLDQWAPGDPSYNAGLAMEVDGPLSVDRLRAALWHVVERHEALRTVFRTDENGTPEQVVLDEWTLEVDVVDLSYRPPHEREIELAQVLRAAARRSFDLTADLMVRATVVRTGSGRAVLLIGEHHIAVDGWSDAILLEELAEAYTAYGEGRPPRLPELAVQYRDFALWQRNRLSGPLLERLTGYWRSVLAGAPVLRLPLDRARPPVQSFAGAHYQLAMTGSVVSAVAALSRDEGATPYMTLYAAFVAGLHRWTGCTDICVGTPMAGRGRVELETLIGFFSNTLVLRLQLADDPTFRELVRGARGTTLAAFEHQELPFEKVVEAVAPRRDPSVNPLFQVNFRVQTSPPRPLRLPGLDIRPIGLDIGFARFDLALELSLQADGIYGYIEYNEALFEPATAADFGRGFESLLRDGLRHPDVPVSALDFDVGTGNGGGRPPIKGFRRR